MASPNLVLGLRRQTRKTKICIGPSLPQVEAGMEVTVKFFFLLIPAKKTGKVSKLLLEVLRGGEPICPFAVGSAGSHLP